MKCVRCGKPLVAGAAFCPSCGAPVAATPSPAGVGTAATMATFDAQQKRQKAILIGLVILAVLAAIVTGLVTSGILQFGAKKSDSTLQASGTRPTGVLQAKGTQPPPVLPVTNQKMEMPKEVEDWLNHLKMCEDRKREVVQEELPKLFALKDITKSPLSVPEDVDTMSSPDEDLHRVPHEPLIGENTRTVKKRVTDISDTFRMKPPPDADCRELAVAFDSGLNGLADSYEYIGNVVSSVDPSSSGAQADSLSKVSELQRFMATYKANVDDQFKQANDLLNQICAKYGRKPWFDIDSSGGSSLLSSGN